MSFSLAASPPAVQDQAAQLCLNLKRIQCQTRCRPTHSYTTPLVKTLLIQLTHHSALLNHPRSTIFPRKRYRAWRKNMWGYVLYIHTYTVTHVHSIMHYNIEIMQGQIIATFTQIVYFCRLRWVYFNCYFSKCIFLYYNVCISKSILERNTIFFTQYHLKFMLELLNIIITFFIFTFIL